MSELPAKNKSSIVLVACIMFNLTIGVLYAWSVLTSWLTAPLAEGGFGWSASQAGLPFSIAVITLATAMLVGGRIQDRIGPRWVVTAGGALAGLGIILCGLVGNSVAGITVSFGVIAATGMGFGYGSVTPPALKWFHPGQKGLISGLIVGGFGLSAVYFSPLTNALLERFGIETTFFILGSGIFIISTSCAQFVRNPPAGHVPPAPARLKQAVKAAPAADFLWKEMFRTKRFWLMFAMFLFVSSTGLMIIGNVSRIAQLQAGIGEAAVLAMLASLLALMNTLGRVIGGQMSDKIGRINTLFVTFALQMANMAFFAFYQSLAGIILGIIIVGFGFGALLSVMPALCADQFGLKNFGLNYGILFLAWGLSGFIAPIMANVMYDTTGSFATAYAVCAAALAVMLLLNFLLKKDIGKRSAA
ncbi:MAG: OFA family MFS transporter [Spirochaetes bacterium]|nr:OFA family MFS transporter [Spirochaetota bacterium]